MQNATSDHLQSPDRVLSTLEKDGSRRWLHPRLAKGRYLTGRRGVAYLLIAVFTLLPYIQINAKPAILFDVIHRKFTFFGYTFLPTDTVLLAILMVTIILLVFIVTALFGRVWCGWACPQTVYLEFVFRPLQRLFTGRSGVGGKASRPVAAWRHGALYLSYFVVCFYLAHTFLAYFVGVDSLRHWIFGSPLDHPAAFLLVAAVTVLMLFDFVIFREQTCILACPYGRLQSVMLDRWSLIIGYDTRRGEPRGRKLAESRKPAVDGSLPVAVTVAGRSISNGSTLLSAPPPGDCIDCSLCVQVCPTGIDIRNGLQLECVGCAQCIDACDTVMDKISRPRGLIRYSSQSVMSGERPRIIRPRVFIYSILIVGLSALLVFLFATKSPTDMTLLRALGRPFDVLPDGRVQNMFRVKLVNRSEQAQSYQFGIDKPGVEIIAADRSFVLAPGEARTEPVQVLAPQHLFGDGKLDVVVRVTAADALPVERTARLLGPHEKVEHHDDK